MSPEEASAIQSVFPFITVFTGLAEAQPYPDISRIKVPCDDSIAMDEPAATVTFVPSLSTDLMGASRFGAD